MPYYRCGGGGKTSTAIKLGSGAGTYDVSSIYKDYAKLTNSNFIVSSTGGTRFTSRTDQIGNVGYIDGRTYASCSASSCSYNADTGILTVTNGSIRLALHDTNGKIENDVSSSLSAGNVWLVIP